MAMKHGKLRHRLAAYNFLNNISLDGLDNESNNYFSSDFPAAIAEEKNVSDCFKPRYPPFSLAGLNVSLPFSTCSPTKELPEPVTVLANSSTYVSVTNESLINENCLSVSVLNPHLHSSPIGSACHLHVLTSAQALDTGCVTATALDPVSPNTLSLDPRCHSCNCDNSSLASNNRMGGSRPFSKKSFETLFVRPRLRSLSASTSVDSSGDNQSQTASNKSCNRKDVGSSQPTQPSPPNTGSGKVVFVSGLRKVPFTIISVLPFHRSPQPTKIEAIPEGRHLKVSSNIMSYLTNQEQYGNLAHIIKSVEEETSYKHLLTQSTYMKSRNILSQPSRKTGSDPPVHLQPSQSAPVGAISPPPPAIATTDSQQEKGPNSNVAASSSNQDNNSTCPYEEDFEGDVHEYYRPHLLDDPELMAGRHRTVLNLPNYLTTVIEYVKPVDLKRDLNNQFRERFPNIQLTLTKMRSLKGDLVTIAKKLSMDSWTVAQAFVFFEKLILKNLVNKLNRKACCGASLLLSAKLNDLKGSDLITLVQEIESTMKISHHELMMCELAILISLDFTLTSQDTDIYLHQQRLSLYS